jgi:uncharacterized membrane protein YdbT with pleckstrin-like domain
MKTELKKEEKIIFQTRPHWLILAGPGLLTLFAVVIGFLIGGYGILLGVVFIGYFTYKLIERNNNLWAVTNLRVVDEYGVFSNNSKESPLEKINNVSYNQSFIGKIFGYGNVQIQTAAEIGSTTYFSVADPKKLKDTITHMQEEYKSYRVRMEASELAKAIATGDQNRKTDLATELEKLHELKQKGILTEEEYYNLKKKILDS